MKRLLSQAIKFASTIVCNGYQVDEIANIDDRIHLDDGDDRHWVIEDQMIEINADGLAKIATIDGYLCWLEFKVCVPIREQDIPATT